MLIIKSKSNFLIFFTLIFHLLLISPVYAKQKEKALPVNIKSGVRHLVKVATSTNPIPISMGEIGNILDFIAGEKDRSYLYYPESWRDTTQTYFEFDIKRDFDSFIKYTFNPNIPEQAARLSSVRLSYWKDGANRSQIWNRYEGLDKPFLISGTEYEVNTPDTNTGAYYGNTIERTLILCKYKGRKVLISLSYQPEESEVGKKGAVLAHDGDWNYFYSGIEGLTMKGLGWASSYMYRSLSIAIYYEVEPGKPLVRNAIFKWLRAGWAGMNMVKKVHIDRGMKRFARDFKFILEHPDLPEPEELERNFNTISKLSTKEMKAIAKDNIKNMIKEYGKGEMLSRRQFSSLLRSGAYLKNMDRREVEGILILDYMKKTLGKDYKGTLFWEEK